MNQRTTVRLPDELLRQAKKKAATEGRTLTALIEDGLRRVLAEGRQTVAARVLPPVSDAVGGQIMSHAEAEELEDAEYGEQLRRGFR